MEIDVKSVIKRIEIRLTEINMKKAEFYDKSGISSASYSQWNTGTNIPSMKKLKCAADCIGVSVEYLLTGQEKEKPDLHQETGLSQAKQEAWDLIQKMDDESLKRFIAAAKAMLGE